MNYRVILLSHKTENDFSFCLLLKRITFTLILIIWKRITMINYIFEETNYSRSARSDAFLRSIGAQALRGGLAKNFF